MNFSPAEAEALLHWLGVRVVSKQQAARNDGVEWRGLPDVVQRLITSLIETQGVARRPVRGCASEGFNREYDVAQAGAVLGVSKQRVRELAARGRIAARRRDDRNGSWVLDALAVNLRAARTTHPTQEEAHRMARRIREDLDGVVTAFEVDGNGKPIGDAYMLQAGQEVPDGVEVGEHVLEPVPGETGKAGFNPFEANAAEVLAYLDGATENERRAVLAAEADGHARPAILEGKYAALAPKTKRA